MIKTVWGILKSMSSVAKSAPSEGTRNAASKTAASSRLRTWLLSSPTQIWRSRISWRIASAVFLTILAVQAGIMSVTIKQFEQEKLSQLHTIALSAISPLIKTNVQGFLASPISSDEAERLFSTTVVKGISIYSADYSLLSSYGEPVTLNIYNYQNMPMSYRSADGNTYEVVLKSTELRRPFYVITKIDSSDIQGLLMQHIQQNILIMLTMSAFVTSVLMLALGRWLLEPILFMRDNLIAASADPENPTIAASPFDSKDEIGSTIDLAQTLIRQNADNFKQIKTAAETRIHKLAYFDTLTGLPNRTLFLQKLSQRVAGDSNEKVDRFAVIAMDLDHFKDINDSMGHNVGDAILRAVGKRLRAALPETATVSRTGEDEFALTMPLTGNVVSARDVADRVISVIRSQPFKVFNEQFQVRASVGVATFPDDGHDPDVVLKNADIALNRAKEEGRDAVKEYSEDFDRAVQQRFQILRDLRDAMEQNQLSLHYQPQIDLKTQKIIGAEALIRWWKPDASKEGGRFVSPGEFIPVAEQSGLIVPIGEWVMRTACQSAVEWRDKHGIHIRIAVNVSAAQFTQSDICGFVDKVIKETGIEPGQLELEVTESVFMDDINHTIETLKALHGLGIELAIDDFGTGYSSLSYLRQFPIDRLKIDQSFIRNALNNHDDAAIARTIVRLGHSLNLKVIAEGVESADHEKFLIEEGCDEVQGFRYSRPVPKDRLIQFVKNYDGQLTSFNQ